MAGKWCCGGSSSGGGSGGGLAAVATTDTTTVDLSGDGTAGAPISATVLVAPEPNGLEAAAGGLLVAPSADAGNGLTVGSDGRLYAAGSTADVLGVAGVAPDPVGTARSVDVDVTESPAGTFNVGARLSPAWAEVTPAGVVGTDLTHAMSVQHPIPGSTLTVPETGVYEVSLELDGATFEQAASTLSRSMSMTAVLWRNGTPYAGRVVHLLINFDGLNTRLGHEATTTFVRRLQLNAGDTIGAGFNYQTGNTATNGGGERASFSAFATLGYHKISD